MNTQRVNGTEIITDYSQAEWLSLRAKDITSTDASALFGISPYLTPFELWHRKKSATVIQFEPSERMKWGTRLQSAIAAGIGEDNKWDVQPMPEYIRKVKLAMGSSFDFKTSDAILEIKNVDSLAYKDGWLVIDDNVEAPPHIELQLQHQLAVSGKALAYIGALIGGNRVVLIRRERDEKVIDTLETKISRFWESIDKNKPPEQNFVKDAAFISKLYQYAEPGKIMQGNDQMATMVEEYQSLGRTAKTAEEGRKAIKAELLTMIGEAEKVQYETFSISAGMIGPAHVEYDREGYRDFRVFAKKVKEAKA